MKMFRTLKTDYNLDVSFAGSWFGSREPIRELAVVLLIALALLYFILAAQFGVFEPACYSLASKYPLQF